MSELASVFNALVGAIKWVLDPAAVLYPDPAVRPEGAPGE